MGRLHVNRGDRILASHINQLADYEVRGENCYEDELGAYFMGTKESDAVEFRYGELKDDLAPSGTATIYRREWSGSAWVTDTDADKEFEAVDVLGIYRGRKKDKFTSPHNEGSIVRSVLNTDSNQWEIVEITPHALWITGSLTDDFDTDEDFTVDGVAVMFPTGAIIVDTDPAANITAHNGHDWDGSNNALAELRWNEASTQWDCVELDC